MDIFLFGKLPKNSSITRSPSGLPPQEEHRKVDRKVDRRLLMFLASHLACGLSAALVSVGALIAFNIGGVRDLIVKSEIGWVAVLLLAFGFIITFGSAAMGIAIMTHLSSGPEPD